MRKLNKYKNFFSLFSQNGSEKIRQNKLSRALPKIRFSDLTKSFGAVLSKGKNILLFYFRIKNL